MPTSSANAKFCSDAPPKASRATSVITTVARVFTERDIVCTIDVLTIFSYASPGISLMFSRIRSRMTIVSITEYPMTVSTAARNASSARRPESA